jgi:predicted transcriptional regulator
MDSREAIEFVTGSQVRPEVLRSTSTPATLDDLTTTLPHTEEAICDAIDWYEDQGWVKRNENQYVQTAIGAVVLRRLDEQRTQAYGTTPDTLLSDKSSEDGNGKGGARRGDLKFIIDSRLREQMLRSAPLPANSGVLSEEYETTLPTASRTTESLESAGWFKKRGRSYYRTDSGELALNQFDGLRRVIEQAASKNECLRWLDRELADLPIENLASASQAVNSPEHTDATEELFGELVNSEFDRYRGMITYVSTSAARQFSPQIQDGVQSELLVTSNVLKHLPMTGNPAEMVRDGLKATNFDLLIAPQLPASLSIFDDEAVFICPRPEDVQGDTFGALVSVDEKVVERAIDLYETYYERSRRPPDHLVHALLDKLDPSPRLAGLLSD